MTTVGAGLLGFLLWVADARAEDCPQLEPAITSAAYELALNQLANAELSLDQFRDGIACSPRLEPLSVSRYFQAQAVLLHRQGKAQGSGQALAAAKRLAPDGWNTDLGIGSDYDRFQQVDTSTGEPVKLKLQQLESQEWVAVDGTVVDKPFRVAPGLHVIQVGPPDGPARFGREIEVVAGEVLNLTLPLASEVDSTWRDAEITYTTLLTPQERRRRTLLAGLITGATSAALYGTAVGVRQAYDRNPTSALRSATNTLQALSVVGGTGAAVTVGVALGTGR